jgi:glucose/arabinose dehydrogenase
MYGVRNPWRISFDRSTGDLWVGDVGDDEWEEVDYLPATNGKNAGRGDNLGWSIYEGAHRDKWRRKLPAPTNAIPPIFEWSHKQGCAVIGGYVYRGKQIENLQGQYVFGDLCNGKVRRLKRNGKSVTVAKLVAAPKSVSFAQDSSGEIYVLTEKALFRLSPTS